MHASAFVSSFARVHRHSTLIESYRVNAQIPRDLCLWGETKETCSPHGQKEIPFAPTISHIYKSDEQHLCLLLSARGVEARETES